MSACMGMKTRRRHEEIDFIGDKHNGLTRLVRWAAEAGSGGNPIVGRAPNMEEKSERRGCSTAPEDGVDRKREDS
jgi:hypothetical protein